MKTDSTRNSSNHGPIANFCEAVLNIYILKKIPIISSNTKHQRQMLNFEWET